MKQKNKTEKKSVKTVERHGKCYVENYDAMRKTLKGEKI